MITIKPIKEVTERCLYCGHIYSIRLFTLSHDGLMAFKIKVDQYLKHRIKCAGEWFEKNEGRCL